MRPEPEPGNAVRRIRRRRRCPVSKAALDCPACANTRTPAAHADMASACRRRKRLAGATAAPQPNRSEARGTFVLRPHMAVRPTVLATFAAPLAHHPEAAAVRAQHTREQHESMLLAVVETLVERTGSLGDLLQRGAAGLHHVGHRAQPFHGIARLISIRAGG